VTDVDDLAETLRAALLTYDLERIESVLDPHVTWGDCGSPADVVAVVSAMQAQGVVPTGVISSVEDDRIVMTIEATVGADSMMSYQAVFVADDKVVEIVQCQTHEEAMSARASGGFVVPDGPNRFESVAPVLPVGNMADAIAHYTALGFEVESYDGGQFYAFARRGDVHLHLSHVGDLDQTTTTSAIYLYVEDAKGLFAEWRDAGLDGRFGAPLETDYGLIEAFHIDPWGNLLRYGSPIA